MRSKSLSAHAEGNTVEVDVYKGQSINCSNIILKTKKLECVVKEADEDDLFSDAQVSLEELEVLSKLLAQLVENIKSDSYINGAE